MVTVAQAFRQCTELRKFEFGLYAHGDARGLSRAVDLLRPILEALPASRLTHLTFVLDLGDSSFSPDRLIPWETLDAQLSRVCVDDGWPLQVRIERYVAGDRPLQRRVDYQDQRVWCRRLPTMQHRMGVRDTVLDERRESSSLTRCCFFDVCLSGVSWLIIRLPCACGQLRWGSTVRRRASTSSATRASWGLVCALFSISDRLWSSIMSFFSLQERMDVCM